MSGDPYVLVEGGLVQNDPCIPVFDLDVLSATGVGPGEISEVESMWRRASGSGIGELQWVVDRCDEWLTAHDPNWAECPTG